MSKLRSNRKHIRRDSAENPRDDRHLPTSLRTLHAGSAGPHPLSGNGPDDFGLEIFEEGSDASPGRAKPRSEEGESLEPADAKEREEDAKIRMMFERFLEPPTQPRLAMEQEQPRPLAPPSSPIPPPEDRVGAESPVKATPASTLVRRHGWHPVASGILGTLCACALSLAVWMGGFKGAAALPTDADGLAADDQGPILGERPSGRDQEHFDEFVAIAKALELAREHKYADAVKALEASPLPKHESLKGSVALNRQELIEHWRIEERLHAAQYLTLFHRDPVAAVDRLLSDYRKAEEQLHETRSEIARMPKPVDTKPLYQEIERLREAHGLAESRAKRVDGAMKEVREANESAAQALARARAMEERLNATERKLRTAEERLRQPASEPPLSGIFTATPVKFAEPTGEGRSAYQAYTQGLTLYREGRYEEAERFLTQAVRGDSQDARYEYFLGLAELALGKAELADGSFRRGAMLERENRPSHVFVLVALDTVGGEARRQLDRYRTSSPQNSSERQPERPLAPPLSLDRIDTPGSAR